MGAKGIWEISVASPWLFYEYFCLLDLQDLIFTMMSLIYAELPLYTVKIYE